MSGPIEFQIIKQNGKPAFVIAPYDEFIKLFPEARVLVDGDYIPHEVMRYVLKENYSRVRAWREYLGLTQAEVAERMGITQAALSQIEAPGARPRKATREKLAIALGLRLAQLY